MGLVHIALTLRDLIQPTCFKPSDETLIERLKASGVVVLASAPGAQNMWRAWLDANFTHALGLIVFALIPLVIALHDLALIAILSPLCMIIALAYVIITLLFWSLPAAILATIGLVCFLVAALI
jgi:hypothetical protein